MGFFRRQEDEEEEYVDKDFCFEDIVADEPEPDPDLVIYEDEFEMEPYLDGFRDPARPGRNPGRPVFTIWIAAGLVLAVVLIGALIWLAIRREKKIPEANIPVSVPTTLTQEPEVTPEADAPSGTDGAETPEEEAETPVEEEPEEPTPFIVPSTEPVSGTAEMAFEETNDTVTAMDVAFIHAVPDAGDVYNKLGQLANGQLLTRTGINRTTGWSRVEYEGATAYMISDYLTADPEYTPYLGENSENRVTTQDGSVILFAACDDEMEPGNSVNLRTEPSVAAGNESVAARIHDGIVVHRTGISPDSGWSRVEYEGEVLYVVTGYMNTVEPQD